MNWDQVEGNWKQVKGLAREKWAQLTDDRLEQVAGRRDRLIGQLQEQYGVTRETAEWEVERWVKQL